MREVFEKRTEAHTRANRAQSELTRKLSLQAAGQRMAKRLHKIAIIGTPSHN
jgi:hypothetical protein